MFAQLSSLGPIAPLRFSIEIDQVGRRELVHGDCMLHHFEINLFGLELEFKPDFEQSSAELCIQKMYKVAVCADNYMICLEFLRLTNTSRRREVHSRNTMTASFTHASASIHHLLVDVCQTVHLPSFRNII